MKFQVFEEGVAPKQLFLASLLANAEVRNAVEEIVKGGYEWEFSYDSCPSGGDFAGVLWISSDYFSSCTAESIFAREYFLPKSFADDVSILYLIFLFQAAGETEGEGDDSGGEGESANPWESE